VRHGSQRQAVDISVLAEFAADGMLGCPRLDLGIATAMAATALRRGQYPSRSSGEVLSDVAMLSKPNSAPSVGSRSDTSRSDSEKIADGVGILGAIQAMDHEAAGRALAFPGTVERRGQPAGKRCVLGFGRMGHAGRRHRRGRSASAALSSQVPGMPKQIVEKPPASRLIGPSAGFAVRELWHPTPVLLDPGAILGRIRRRVHRGCRVHSGHAEPSARRFWPPAVRPRRSSPMSS